MTIAPSEYLAACKRHFGATNPDRMREPVWEWMVRQGHNPYIARRELGLEHDYGVCGMPNDPDWCFDRMGMPTLQLPDGRKISIAGEHEDHYDPDFCIYNDVIVEQGDDVAIYGYPREVFPPTDFHTATLIGSDIWLLGSLSYLEDRGTTTQVFVLDTSTYKIRRVAPTGVDPGWLSKHVARLLPDRITIEVSKGDTFSRRDEDTLYRKNLDVFRLDTRTRLWTQTTDTSSWRQFRIEFEQDPNDMAEERDLGWYTGEILLELGHKVEQAREPDESEADPPDRIHTLWVRDIPVRIDDSYGALGVVIEGLLPEADRVQLFDGLRTLLVSAKRRITNVIEC